MRYIVGCCSRTRTEVARSLDFRKISHGKAAGFQPIRESVKKKEGSVLRPWTLDHLREELKRKFTQGSAEKICSCAVGGSGSGH